jgi:flagellar protein FliS
MPDVTDHYLNEKVAAATPAELTGMLFDKAVLSLKRAKAFLVAGNFEAAAGRLANAGAVVLELRGSLNSAAGDIANRLEALYVWVSSRILLASSRRDPTNVQEALDVLTPLQEAWREACVGVPV